MLAHGLTIALLFLLTGQIEAQTRTLELDSMGGLGSKLPALGFLFGLAGAVMLSAVMMPFSSAHVSRMENTRKPPLMRSKRLSSLYSPRAFCACVIFFACVPSRATYRIAIERTRASFGESLPQT